MGKVLFFDIDGTLVNADGVVPASAKKRLSRHAWQDTGW